MIYERTSKTPLEELQALVGGYIEILPHFNLYKGGRCVVVCNEDGRALGLPINWEASKHYMALLGPDLFIEPILGPVVVVYGGLK